jgi:hypothetical protein
MGTTISAAQWLNLGVNVLLPIIVAIVTRANAAGGVKAVTLLVLSALSGFLIAWLDALNHGLVFDFSQAGFTAVTGFIVAVAAHFSVWKPAGVTGSDGAAAQVGIGQGSGAAPVGPVD